MVTNSQLRNSQLPKIRARVGGWIPFRFGSWVLLVVVALGVGSSACAKAQAASVPNGPPLQVPLPPPRVLVPVAEVVAAAPEPVPEAPPPAAAAPRTPPRTPTEPRPQPAPPAAAVAPPPAPAEPRDLRAAPSPTNATTERTVRDTLVRATRDINRVDYGRLSADGRAQYEQSKRFSQQAEQALKERNVLFAATLADKAAQIAAELLGR